MQADEGADVCLILEGNYPYVSGGVATWTQQLIEEQSHLTFLIVSISAKESERKYKYRLPKNVLGVQDIILQDFSSFSGRFFYPALDEFEELYFKTFVQKDVSFFDSFLRVLEEFDPRYLLNSRRIWSFYQRLYREQAKQESFLDFFWSCRFLFGSLFSVLFAPVPKARVYHSLCTGYAGLFAAKASIETKRPATLTEHGIYSNERRIEIIAAQWLGQKRPCSLSMQHPMRGLKNFWIDNFSVYARIAYKYSKPIITLYEGNRDFQLIDGADKENSQVIPNGIDYERFRFAKKEHEGFFVAFIGRIVPIKDVKTCIRAASIVCQKQSSVRFLFLGPFDEDKAYYQECLDLCKSYDIEEKVSFLGRVDIEKYLPQIDLLLLTSISEAQPLVILEAGAAGIPCVASDVGACKEMILGRSEEEIGGLVTPLMDAQETAFAILRFVQDQSFYKSCSKNIQKRVREQYNLEETTKAYKKLYQDLMEEQWQESALP